METATTDLDTRADLGMYDEVADEPPICGHKNTYEAGGSPEYSGRCAVYAVCEDCGESLAQVGWDSVL